MKAELFFEQRVDFEDGTILEIVYWRVHSPVPPSTHNLKYSLFYTAVLESGRLGMTTNEARAIIGIFRVSRLPILSPASNNCWQISGQTWSD